MSTPIHDWVSPRLDAMLADAVKAGMDRQIVVAVMTDIIASSAYNEAVTPPEDPVLNPVSDIEHEAIPASPLHFERPIFSGGYRAD
jgi:hypothetical protein